MKNYLPEGLFYDTPANRNMTENAAALLRAARSGAVLEGRAVMCTKGRDLVVRAGDAVYTIPRQETALGIDTGETRDIAVLSRVGKCVSFVVTGAERTDTGLRPVLSRRRAQEAALRHLMEDLCPGDVIPAVVTHLEQFGAFVDVGCGLTSLIGIENTSVARIAHPAERFYPGQRVFAAVTRTDEDMGRVWLSHKELLGTWRENAALFSPGDTVEGVVRGIKDYGIFVELAPNLSGLAEPQTGVKVGDGVSVYLKAILPEKHKVKLSIIDVLPGPAARREPRYFIREGNVAEWDYFA